MEDNKLLIGGIVIIALLVAIPVVGPMLRGSGYDPALDRPRMETMEKAIARYAAEKQQYPPSLHHLVPEYLETVPLTSTNLQFEYNPETGKIINPSIPVEGKEDQRAGRSGSGGVSPATDAMTGLSVSEELNF